MLGYWVIAKSFRSRKSSVELLITLGYRVHFFRPSVLMEIKKTLFKITRRSVRDKRPGWSEYDSGSKRWVDSRNAWGPTINYGRSREPSQANCFGLSKFRVIVLIRKKKKKKTSLGCFSLGSQLLGCRVNAKSFRSRKSRSVGFNFSDQVTT